MLFKGECNLGRRLVTVVIYRSAHHREKSVPPGFFTIFSTGNIWHRALNGLVAWLILQWFLFLSYSCFRGVETAIHG